MTIAQFHTQLSTQSRQMEETADVLCTIVNQLEGLKVAIHQLARCQGESAMTARRLIADELNDLGLLVHPEVVSEAAG